MALISIKPRRTRVARGPYELRGANKELFECQAPEVVLSGSAGTGKSLTALARLHFLCSHVPGLRALICRKTRESLTESALVTFEDRIIPEDHPILKSGGQRRMRQAYHYPNGSVIVVGGLDKPGKVMSTEYDIAYVQEAIEVTEEDWESLSSRLRNGKLPYQQIMGDTNPDAPTHWLKRRCDEGKCVMLYGRHEDNPAYYDLASRAWTPAGKSYIARLDALNEPRRSRLRYGLWRQAEGAVYEGWRPEIHLLPRTLWTGGDPPWQWPRFWVVDFGFTNPFVWKAYAEDPDGRLFRYREIYQTKTLVEDHAKRIRELWDEEIRHAQLWAQKRYLRDGNPPPPGTARDRALSSLAEQVKSALRPRKVICDHDAEDRATLERHLKLPTQPARKEVRPGIQAVAARLRPQEDGKPRLFLLRDSLDRRDPALKGRGLPTCTEEEFDGYVWDTAGGRRVGEEPAKRNDHGMDALRYLCHDRDSQPTGPCLL